MAERTVKVVLQIKDDFSVALKSYEQGLGRAEKASKNLEGAAKKTGSSLKDFNGKLEAIASIWTVRQAFGFLEDLTALGQQSKIASATFEALAGSADIAAARLEALRKATGNTVDDLTLMQSSNKLLQMDLAQNTEDLARFTEIATKLGRAMGTDVNTSLENFALLLANNSYLRLDTFGISSAKVRERVKELKEEIEGLDTSTAFMQATLEEGEKALNRLGAAAEAGETSFERVRVELGNFAVELAEAAAGGLEMGAMMLETFDAITEGTLTIEEFIMALRGASSAEIRQHMEERTAAAEAEANALQRTSAIYKEYRAELEFLGLSHAEFAKHIAELERMTSNPLIKDADWIKAYVGINPDLAGYGEMAERMLLLTVQQLEAEDKINARLQAQRDLRNFLVQSGSDLLVNLSQQMLAAQEAAEIEKQRAETYAKISELSAVGAQAFNLASGLQTGTLFDARGFDQLQKYTTEIDRMFKDVEKMHEKGLITDEDLAYARQLTEESAQWLRNAEEYGRSLGDTYSTKLDTLLERGERFFNKSRMLGDILTIAPQDAEIISGYANQAQVIYGEMQELAKEGLVDEDEVAHAKMVADEMARMNDEAQKAANAVNTMSLKQLLGEGSGGVAGEITDMVLGKLRDMGYSEEQLAAAQQKMDLETGRKTDLSLAMDQQFAPLLAQIADTFGPEVAAQAAERFAATLKVTQQQGVTGQNQLDMLYTAIGYKFGGEGQQFEVRPGDTPSSVAERTGLSVDEVIAIASNTGTARGLQPGQYSAGPGLVSLNNAVVNPALNNQFFGLPPDANAYYGITPDIAGSMYGTSMLGFGAGAGGDMGGMGSMYSAPMAGAMMGGSLPVGAGLPTPFNTFGVFGEFGAGLGGAEGGPDAQGRADEDFAAMHEQLSDAKQAADELAASIGEVQHPIRDARDQTELFIQELDILAAKSINIKVHAELLMDAQLKSLLAAVRGNGGRMPGADPRVPADPGGFGVS